MNGVNIIKLIEKVDLVAIPDVGYLLEESITKEEKLSGVEVLADPPAIEKNKNKFFDKIVY